MKSITDALAAHLAGDTTSTSRLWKIKHKATTQATAVQAFYSGPNSSDPSCNQGQVGSDWEFVNGLWRTVATLTPNSETGWIYAYGFNNNVPAGATITGILCQVIYNSQALTGSYIQEVSLFNGSTPIGAEKTPHLLFTVSQQTMGQGGQQDSWGYALTDSVVNNTNFGFGIRAFSDGVRLFLNGASFAMTVYYTLPASNISGGQTVSIASSLTKHTNFTGSVEADDSADSQACSQGQRIAIDADNVMYIFNDSGVVHRFDATSGALLGTLGTFTLSHPYRGHMRILEHPTRGRWLVAANSLADGMGFQLMAINAKDGSGAAMSPGTVTNDLGTMYAGILSGGNTGDWDVDVSGNIWQFGTDASGANAGLQLLNQVSFTGDTTIAISATTNLGTLYGWTLATGLRFDPLSGNLVLWGKDSGASAIIARVDQNASFAIQASSLALPDYTLPYNMGANGQYMVSASPALIRIQVSDFSTVQTQQGDTDYGLATPLGLHWYDPLHNFAWVSNGPGGQYFWVLDLTNPSPSGAAQLLDPSNSMSDSGRVSTGGFALSPDGNYFATEFQGGAGDTGTPSGIGFIDFWGAASLPAAGTPAPTVVLGFTDHDLDILYDDGSGDGPVLYIARTGATWSAIDSKPDMSVDNLEIDSFLESDLITETDLRGGLYDGAECTIYLVNWADLTQKHLTLRYGVWGNVKIINGLFTTEIRGLAYRLGLTLGSYYGPLCRAELFSNPLTSPNAQWYCNLNASLYQQTGSVASSADALHIVPSAGLLTKGTVGAGGIPPAGYYNFGLMRFTSGANQNLKYEIEIWDGTTLTLKLPLYAPALPGDTFVIEPGCDKLITTCINKFANAINHRGEPWIPGLDAILDMFPSA